LRRLAGLSVPLAGEFRACPLSIVGAFRKMGDSSVS
jgi:hypothetical protein